MRIDPVPTEEEAAAVVAALELLWPVQAAPEPRRSALGPWRFSGRPWRRPVSWKRRR